MIVHHTRLGITQLGAASGGVPRMSNRYRTRQRIQYGGRKDVRYQSHAAMTVRYPTVVHGDDARRFLAAMLQRVEAEIDVLGSVRDVGHAKNATHC